MVCVSCLFYIALVALIATNMSLAFRMMRPYSTRTYAGSINTPTALNMAYSGSARQSRGPRQSSRGGIRQARVARSIRDEISSIICDMDIKAKVYPDEDLLRGTAVSEVEVSPDLSYAKVFVSVLGNSVEKRQVFVWLCENVGQVRYSLAKRLRHMRRVPEITFKLANTNQAADLVSLMEDLSPAESSSSSSSSSVFDYGEEEEYEDFEE